jgi:hypothetical protein
MFAVAKLTIQERPEDPSLEILADLSPMVATNE